MTTAVLFVWFALAPLNLREGGEAALWLAAAVIFPGVVLTLQTLAVARSPYPRLRAVEAMATSFPLLIFLFAATYYAMAAANQDSFNQVLTRTDALYFTVTIFATVGFGDLVATSQAARGAVTVQMLADIVLIGVAVRVLLGTIQQRRAVLGQAPRNDPSVSGG